jgi:hypothetical protein
MNKKVIVLIIVLSMILSNTYVFAEMVAVETDTKVLNHKVYNVSTNETLNLTELIDGKYNIMVYGSTKCTNTYATLQALDKFISITKPGSLQAFYFDTGGNSSQDVISLAKKANLKNIILCSDQDKLNGYTSSVWNYVRYLIKGNEMKSSLAYDLPFVVMTNKKGQIKYYSTGTQKEGSLFEGLSTVAKGDDIFVAEYINYGIQVEAKNISLRESQSSSSEVLKAYLMPSPRINPEAASIKELQI